MCLSSDLNPQAVSGVLPTSLSAQILNWGVDLRAESKHVSLEAFLLLLYSV